MNRCALLGLSVLGVISIATAADADCPTFHNLTNGTLTDATQVMDNFNHILNCISKLAKWQAGKAADFSSYVFRRDRF